MRTPTYKGYETGEKAWTGDPNLQPKSRPDTQPTTGADVVRDMRANMRAAAQEIGFGHPFRAIRQAARRFMEYIAG